MKQANQIMEVHREAMLDAAHKGNLRLMEFHWDRFHAAYKDFLREVRDEFAEPYKFWWPWWWTAPVSALVSGLAFWRAAYASNWELHLLAGALNALNVLFGVYMLWRGWRHERWRLFELKTVEAELEHLEKSPGPFSPPGLPSACEGAGDSQSTH